MKFDNRYALVLGGGGARGSYQIGAWKAFRELNIHFSGIIGTSVGALNGAFIAQGDYDRAYEMWSNVTIENIVKVPASLIQKGAISLNKENIRHFKDLQRQFVKGGGLDTEPLRMLIERYLDEKRLRKTGIDLGVVTYQLNNLKPITIFLDEIRKDELKIYLQGSASLPGFKLARHKKKVFVDGGVFDNLPFNVMKRRGYKKIIVVDISGLGVFQEPNVEGTQTIYIKNTQDLGGVVDFSPESAARNIKMGYLDTLKVFEKVGGIDYYFDYNERLLHKLREAFFHPMVIASYKKYLEDEVEFLGDEGLTRALRDSLPKEMRNYREMIIPFIECAATSVGVERLEHYDLKQLLKRTWDAIRVVKKRGHEMYSKNSSFDLFFNSIKDKTNIFKLSAYNYNLLLDYVFGNGEENVFYTKALSQFLPHLLPAKIFFKVLEHYFHEDR